MNNQHFLVLIRADFIIVMRRYEQNIVLLHAIFLLAVTIDRTTLDTERKCVVFPRTGVRRALCPAQRKRRVDFQMIVVKIKPIGIITNRADIVK